MHFLVEHFQEPSINVSTSNSRFFLLFVLANSLSHKFQQVLITWGRSLSLNHYIVFYLSRYFLKILIKFLNFALWNLIDFFLYYVFGLETQTWTCLRFRIVAGNCSTHHVIASENLQQEIWAFAYTPSILRGKGCPQLAANWLLSKIYLWSFDGFKVDFSIVQRGITVGKGKFLHTNDLKLFK